MRLTISAPNGPFEGYLATPTAEVSGEGPWPGVVVIHDALGFNDDVRQTAGRFATAGYVAIVPNLYARGGAIRCVRGIFKALSTGHGPAFEDIEAARQLIADRDDCTGRIGIVGFCMGGGFALLCAPRGFQASAPYYGVMPKDLAMIDGACPVVASLGGKDFTLKGAAATLEAALTERNIPHDVKEYPDAGHSFANRISPAALVKVLGFGYHHESSEDAWRRVLTFFGEHLGG
ncbi:dienelactone hydrolase family protein [Kutzneria buriramensis]|uniref:Carboxymethylenebutenolidase n=1 Tax=Kutzneria buriramensis TaxID=1045776 RepID=A0A3E0GVK4_9PSEU|nr:dienelactone hydrolase family protein [Kutzneria buriramensis]REH29475.1 carboxymethylenebutenolidase [Kutzneria buriramensis]